MSKPDTHKPDTEKAETQPQAKPRCGKGSGFCGKKGRSGPPKGNHNATRHGLRASGLPPGCTYIEGQISAFKRYVRAELGGTLSTWQEATLQSACRHETRALLAARWLRLEAKALTISERAKLLDCIGRASDQRDKCLMALGLDRDPMADAIDALYATPEPEHQDTEDRESTDAK